MGDLVLPASTCMTVSPSRVRLDDDIGVRIELRLVGRDADLGLALVAVLLDDVRQLVFDDRPALGVGLEQALEALGLLLLFGELLLDHEDLEPGQAIELELEDGVDLLFVELEALHQLLRRVLLAFGLADDADDLVERVVDLGVALEDVDAPVELVEIEAEAPRDDLEAEVEEVAQAALEVEALGAADFRIVRR